MADQVKINLTGSSRIKAVLSRIAGPDARKALDATAEELESYVHTEAGKHTKTGALARSVDKRRIAGGWVIFNDPQVAPHAIFVHGGTKSHEIRPRNKSIIRFATKNLAAFAKGEKAGEKFTGKANAKRFGFVFTKSVRHPGTSPDKWMQRAADKALKIYESELNKRMK